jgi:precorrin-6A/cobalt-precorrin-6A reductase
MILLLGGTSETAIVAEALAAAGQRVLVSTATDVALDVGGHANITRRCGRLDEDAMTALAQSEHARAIVDVSHPYAVALRATAQSVVRKAGIPYLTYLRPTACAAADGVRLAADHAEAARMACEPGRSVLLTIGSRNVAVYAREAAQSHVPLIARVLPEEDSIAACLAAGLPRERIVTGRGPFSVEANREIIRRFGVGVVVTKDSGEAGGFPAKQEAARLESCLLVVVGRAPQAAEQAFDNLEELIMAARGVSGVEGAREEGRVSREGAAIRTMATL